MTSRSVLCLVNVIVRETRISLKAPNTKIYFSLFVSKQDSKKYKTYDFFIKRYMSLVDDKKEKNSIFENV